MDLLGQEMQSNKEPKGKKLVLTLLIISIILLIVLLIVVEMLKGSKPTTLSLSINEKNVSIEENMLIQSENGKTYISIQNVAKLIGNNYIEGGYLQDQDNKNKCYIENSNQIIEYIANSNNIRKVILNSDLGNEEYKLKNKIIINNNIKYIALEDLNVGCNVIYSFSEEEYKIKLYTTENLVEIYNKELEEKGLKISDSVNNQKAMLYNMLVVSNNKEGKMGVIDSNYNSVISYIYNTIEYNEYLELFIVSDNNKYGIALKDGRKIIEPKYQDIEIINYSPLLYKVKLNNEYGVLSETGEKKVNIGYDKIGFNENSNTMQSVCIIKDLVNKHDGIVVCKDNKYGIVDLETGKMIIKCQVDKIYSKTYDSEENKYYVEIDDEEIELKEYMDELNTTTIITN